MPERDPAALWEKLVLDGFQAGLSWITILKKREAFRAAFAGFDPAKVARFGAKDVKRLMGDAGIVRAQAKIEATIRGAQLYVEAAARGESFADYCWGFTGGKVLRGDGHSRVVTTPLSEAISKALKARGFKFVGPTIVYAFMQATGFVNDHLVSCHCHERVRRMSA